MTENSVIVYEVKPPNPQESLQLQEIATSMFSSGFYPNVKNKFGAFAVIQYGAEIGIPPAIALQNISIIKGKPACDSQLLLSLMQKRGIEWNVVTETNEKCVIDFRRGKNKYRSEYTIEDAKMAGLADKENWKKMPKSMLFWRCVSHGARRIDPGCMTGMYLKEELSDDATGFESAKNITPEKPVDPPAETNNDENDFVSLIKELTQDNESLYDYFDTKIHELTNRKYNHYAHFINSHKDFVKKELDGDYSIATEMLSQNFEMYEKCYLLYIESKLKAKDGGE